MLNLVEGENKIGIKYIMRWRYKILLIIVTDAVMYNLAETIMMAVDADMVNLYLVETEGEITRYCQDPESEPG